MAKSRSGLVVFGVGTLLICLLLVKDVTEAGDSHQGCHGNGAHPDKGDECRQDDGDADDDFDDTYKVVNKLSVTLSGSAGLAVNNDDSPDDDDDDPDENLVVLGH
ncbi:hypothetical protein O6P43_020775 [Quillaja saponaria]|uniref:Uncharacterized protein n=1 Tax=Quillaja saponaria TaxID=32244 RepID=A0AAD7PLT3_QUISA|nr:hypothetical protein O6P43_020775 [Quillaja saponaria]